jgi:hypothetical protein
MWEAIALVVIVSIVGYTGYLLGFRAAYRRSATWYVRPHTPETLARVQLPDASDAPELRVAEGRFVASDLPGGGSRME